MHIYFAGIWRLAIATDTFLYIIMQKLCCKQNKARQSIFALYSLKTLCELTYLSREDKSLRMVLSAVLVWLIFLPDIDPLVSMTKTTFFGMTGRLLGAKKWTKYPSFINISPPSGSWLASYLTKNDLSPFLRFLCSLNDGWYLKINKTSQTTFYLRGATKSAAELSLRAVLLLQNNDIYTYCIWL